MHACMFLLYAIQHFMLQVNKYIIIIISPLSMGPSKGMAAILKVSGPGPRNMHCLYVYM